MSEQIFHDIDMNQHRILNIPGSLHLTDPLSREDGRLYLMESKSITIPVPVVGESITMFILDKDAVLLGVRYSAVPTDPGNFDAVFGFTIHGSPDARILPIDNSPGTSTTLLADGYTEDNTNLVISRDGSIYTNGSTDGGCLVWIYITDSDNCAEGHVTIYYTHLS